MPEPEVSDRRSQVLELVMILAFGVGLICLSLGAWMAWQPAGLLVAGAGLMLIPVLWVRGAR